MSTQRESRRSVNPILHIWASKLSFFILLLKLKWIAFISHFMVLYFRNVDLDLRKISELFWTPVLSRYGDENLTSWKNHLVHLWPASFIRANYVQLPQQNFSRTPLKTEWMLKQMLKPFARALKAFSSSHRNRNSQTPKNNQFPRKPLARYGC